MQITFLCVGAGALLRWSGVAPRIRTGLLLVASLSLGAGWHHTRWFEMSADDLGRAAVDLETPRPAWLRGTVTEMQGTRADPDDPNRILTRFVFDVDAARLGRTWRNASGRISTLVIGDREDLVEGDRIEVAGTLSAIEKPLNPGQVDISQFYRAQGIRLRLVVEEPEGVWILDPDISRTGGSLLRRLGAARAWCRRRLQAEVDPDAAPLAAALLLGRREDVDPNLNQAFAQTGTTHLLAISGLHLQVLAVAIVWLLRLIGVGRRARGLTVAIAALAYATLVGPAPSVVRSTAMTLAGCVAVIRGRDPRPANTLALAALATLALNPSHLFDVGCQLSFLAVAVIIWGVPLALEGAEFVRLRYYEMINRPRSALDDLIDKFRPPWERALRRAVGALAKDVLLSTLVWMAAIPLVAARFHLTSPISVLLNLPLIPLTSLALLAGGVSLPLAALWRPLGKAPAALCALCLRWTEGIVRWGAAQPRGAWFTPGPTWWWMLIFYGLLIVAVASWVNRTRARFPIAAAFTLWVLVALAGWSNPRPPRDTEADVLAVGHGLAVVVQDPDGRILLYDCGKMRDPSVGRRIVAPALWARGATRIHQVMLSHADADHFNGLDDLIERFTIDELLVGPGFEGSSNPRAGELLRRVESRGIPIRIVAAGTSWNWSKTRFSIHHPPADGGLKSSDNARSIVLEIESRGRRFLLDGDIEGPGEVRWISLENPGADAMLAPHHGGRTANQKWLYDALKPKQVIVSQRRPTINARETLDFFARDPNSARLYRTYRDGAVQLRFKPDGLSIRSWIQASKASNR